MRETRTGKTKMLGKDEDIVNTGDSGGRSRIGEHYSRGRKDGQKGFAHVLWLLVVLSGLLFGATLVNIGIGIKVYKSLSRYSAALETLNLSTREVHKSILSLSKVLEEAMQPDEGEETDRSPTDGSI